MRRGPGEAEVDFLIEHCGVVVPIEIKAGATGHLRSLHQIMAEKRLGLAVRVAPRPLGIETVRTGLPGGGQASYRLLTIPPYLLGQLLRLLDLAEPPAHPTLDLQVGRSP